MKKFSIEGYQSDLHLYSLLEVRRCCHKEDCYDSLGCLQFFTLNKQRVIFPPPLKKGATISVVAASAGVPQALHSRLDECIEHLRNQGFTLLEGTNVRNLTKLQSAPPKQRAETFMQAWTNPEVDLILPPWGGNLMITMLDYLDFGEMAKHPPKWIMGFSDTATLTFPFTLKTGIATAHGPSLMQMAPQQSGRLIHEWTRVLSTAPDATVFQRSSEFYAKPTEDWEENIRGAWPLSEPTKWKVLGNEKELSVSGRLIGGCLDTLCVLVGTKYDLIEHFKNLHEKEGVILFLENCELMAAQAARELWNMREAGWFLGLKAVLFGRSSGKPQGDYHWVDAVRDVLGELAVPVIYDADIGHCPPQMTLINGSFCELSLNRDGVAQIGMGFIAGS